MIDKPIDSITTADIATLIENRASEGRSLDYKQELPKGNDESRKDFLADVASFANTSGGHMFFGVSEQRDSEGRATGVPDEAIGLEGTLDTETLKLESIVRDGIEPRIPGVHFRPVPGFRRGPVLVCWIPKSWQAPHMVTFKNLSRFYARGASGKFQLDVPQIRAAFLASETLQESINRFRQERIARIVSDDTLLPLHGRSRVALHVCPVAGFDPARPTEQIIDLAKARPQPLFGGAEDYRYNLDGVFGYRLAADKRCWRYVQVFRSGTIEAVDAGMIQGDLIRSTTFELELIQSLTGYFVNFVEWGIPGPFFVMLSLVGVKGLSMAVSDRFLPPYPGPIDRDVVVVPEVWVEQLAGSLDILATKTLRRALDVVWQAAGWERSPNFNEAGEWQRL